MLVEIKRINKEEVTVVTSLMWLRLLKKNIRMFWLISEIFKMILVPLNFQPYSSSRFIKLQTEKIIRCTI